MGGLSTTIWQLPEGGAWGLVSQRAPTSFDNAGHSTLVSPIAVLDMDGSGLPEVVLRYDEGQSYSDFALRFDGSRWGVAAMGIGGATL